MILTDEQFEAIKKAKVCIWQEDDAGGPDVECISTACARFWPNLLPKPGYHWERKSDWDRDEGEVHWRFYVYGDIFIILGHSYRGNSSISVANITKDVEDLNEAERRLSGPGRGTMAEDDIPF